MDRNLNAVTVSGSGSHSYEQIQVNLENYADLQRRPRSDLSGNVVRPRIKGKFSLRKTEALLGLLCVILLIISIILGTTSCSSLKKEIIDLKTNKSIFDQTHLKMQWHYFGASLYFISWELKTWDESIHDCRKRQAELVIIKTREEEAFVEKLASSMKQNAWIGLTDRESEGVWKWVDNFSMTTGYWNKGEPNNNDGNEDCVSVNQGGWHAQRCDQHMHYICKIYISCCSTQHCSQTQWPPQCPTQIIL